MELKGFLIKDMSDNDAGALRGELELLFTKHPEYSFKGSFYNKSLLYNLYSKLNEYFLNKAVTPSTPFVSNFPNMDKNNIDKNKLESMTLRNNP